MKTHFCSVWCCGPDMLSLQYLNVLCCRWVCVCVLVYALVLGVCVRVCMYQCLFVCRCLRFSVVVLNSGPQAPALYRFLFQPGPTKTNNWVFKNWMLLLRVHTLFCSLQKNKLNKTLSISSLWHEQNRNNKVRCQGKRTSERPEVGTRTHRHDRHGEHSDNRIC